MEPHHIKQLLLDQNRSHFYQAKETPFMVEPLSSLFDPAASTVLDNSLISNPDVNPQAKHMFQYFLQNSRPTIFAHVTESNLHQG